MKTFFVLIFAVFLTGCFKNGQVTTPQTAFDDFEVKQLFEIDGCKMYRFYDGAYRYFTTCRNASVQWNENCGKGCTRTQTIQTHEGKN